MSTNEKQVKELLSNPLFFPKKPAARVKFAMAVSNLLLVGSSELPSAENILRVNADKMPKGCARYLWTGLMVFGGRLPNRSFNHTAIDVTGKSHLYDALFFSTDEELGGVWSTFAKNSLYETVFKHYVMKDMLTLTNNPELFEGISNQLYKTVDEQIKVKEEQIPEELNKEKEKEQQIKTLLNNPSLFPQQPAARVKFTMAMANFFLVDSEPPSKEEPIVLEGAPESNPEFINYLWTALMVFGQSFPNRSFNHESIKVFSWWFSAEKELARSWWSGPIFAKGSLYETVFKHHVTKDMLILTDNPELFEGISSEVYKTVGEQIAAREQQILGLAEPITPKEVEREREEKKNQEAKKQVEAGKREETNRKQKELDGGVTFSTSTADELLNIGLTYYKGSEGVKRDYTKARLCFEKAAEKGNQTALYHLGWIHQYAEGVEKNRLTAVRYYQLAAYSGCAAAQEQLTSLFNSEEITASELTAIAQIYYRGDHEITQDRALAIKLYEKAYGRNDTSAALFLAQHHQTSEEGQKDINLAFSFYMRAVSLGNQEALAPLEHLAEEVSASNQLALSKLYGTFFHNAQRALYWRNKSEEVTQSQLDISFN